VLKTPSTGISFHWLSSRYRNIESGRIDTVEALMRYAIRGMEIRPYFFIPIAEKYRHHLDLQLWMIRKRSARKILADCDVLNVSCKISPIELKTADFGRFRRRHSPGKRPRRAMISKSPKVEKS